MNAVHERPGLTRRVALVHPVTMQPEKFAKLNAVMFVALPVSVE